ncbi:MAG: hypothetical protein MUO40_03295 [Anaerolineaceae bacterium]|nr:hypothetical protein [Anaerolineaceae bacterium]
MTAASIAFIWASGAYEAHDTEVIRDLTRTLVCRMGKSARAEAIGLLISLRVTILFVDVIFQ